MITVSAFRRMLALFAVFLLPAPEWAVAQPYSVQLRTVPAGIPLIKNGTLKEHYADSLEVKAFLEEVLSAARFKGYLLAEAQPLNWRHNQLEIIILLDKRFYWSRLKTGNVSSAVLARAGFPKGNFKNEPLAPQNLQLWYEKILKVYEDSGYPFASVSIDSVSFHGDSVSATLSADPGRLVQLDSLSLTGDVKISGRFLAAYLDLKAGSPYNESRVSDASQRLSQLPFLTSVREPAVEFSGNKAGVRLFLQQENSNRFDGVLGFLSNPESGKPQLTGNIKLYLLNSLKRAESFDFEFRGLPGKARDVNLSGTFPMILSSPLGIDFAFNLLRQDSSFQTLTMRAGLAYRMPKGNFSVFLLNRNSAPVTVAAAQAGTMGNVKNLSFGAGFFYNHTDSRVFPRKGILLQLEADAGQRSLSGATASSIVPQAARSPAYRLKQRAEIYFPAGSRSVVKLNNQTGLLIAKGLFENELYRIGGFSSLRGFDEQSLFASNFAYANLEYRFLLENRSFLFVFGNGGILNYNAADVDYTYAPYGFGSGISLETKAGTFSLSYAVGKQKDNPLNLQAGKIHFGLVTFF